MERAFTGEYWWTNDVGRYDCVSCSQRLFLYEHKFINRSGYATFWNCLENAVKYVTDNIKVNKVTNAHECPTLKGKLPVKRAVCSNVSRKLYPSKSLCILQCESHLGYVYDDGPPPLGLRYQINSASLNFHKKPWFEVPELSYEQRREIADQREKQSEKMALYDELLQDEAKMKMGTYKDRLAEKEQQT